MGGPSSIFRPLIVARRKDDFVAPADHDIGFFATVGGLRMRQRVRKEPALQPVRWWTRVYLTLLRFSR